MKLLLLLLMVAPAAAQEHKFFDKGNVARFSFTAAGTAADAVTTQHFLSPAVQRQWGVPPRELNPIARPFVSHGWPGQLAASSLSFGLGVTWAYVAHRTGHHKIEKFVPWFMGAVSFAAAANNARYYRGDPPPRVQ